jgi:hypothetical protein
MTSIARTDTVDVGPGRKRLTCIECGIITRGRTASDSAAQRQDERGHVSNDTVRIEPSTTRSGPRRRSRKDSLRESLQFPFLVWLAHFIVTQLAATIAYRVGEFRSVAYDPSWTIFEPSVAEESSAYGMIRPPLDGWQHWLVEPFRNWDGTWYSLVAEQSYDPGMSATAAFFPLYPWLMQLGADLTGMPVETIGWIVSHLAFLGGLVMTYKLVSMDFPEKIARWTLIALAVFPTAFFFSAIYTESLFLFLAVTTLWAARKNDWLLAVIMAFFATMTRSAGIMLGLPLAVLFVQQHGTDVRRWFPKAFLGLIPPLGLVIFGWFLQRRGLEFLDWQAQQWQWNRFSAHPGRTFQCVFQGCEETVRTFNNQTYEATVHPWSFRWLSELVDNPSWTFLTSTEFRYMVGQSQVLDVVVTILAIILIVIGLRKLPLWYSAWTIPPMIVPLLAPSSVFPLMSMPRFVLPLIPLFVMAVLLLQNHRRLAIGLATASGILLVLLTSQFALWYWVA